MRAGPDLTGAVASEVRTEIRVNGIVREHASWSVDQSIGSDVPDALTGGEMVASTGKIEWVDTRGTSPSNPFLRVGNWPPKPGDRVTIDQITAADGVTQTCRIFIGKIDSTGGGVHDPNVSIIVDDIDKLRRKVNLRPLQYSMPADDGFWGVPIALQLAAITPVSLALAECGFHSVPPIADGAGTLGAGSFWPSQGVPASTPWQARLPGAPERSKTWGVLPKVPLNPDNTVSPPRIYRDFGVEPRPSPSKPYWFRADMPAWDQSITKCVLAYQGDEKVTISLWRTTNQIRVYLAKTLDEPMATIRATLDIPQSEDVRVVCKITYTPNLTVEVRGSHDPNNSVTAVGGVPDAGGIDRYVICPWQGVIGSMHLTNDSTVGGFDKWLNFQPSVKYNVAPYGLYSTLGLSYAHKQFNLTALELVKDAAKSLMATIWIDEDGVFNWADIEQLNYQPVRQTFKSGRILDLKWDDLSTVARRVGVKYRSILVQGGAKSPVPGVVVWRGPGSTLKSGESMEEWVNPENADVDWIVLDQTMDTGDANQRINSGSRSVVAGTFDGGGVYWNGAALEKVDWGAYKFALNGFTDGRDITMKVPGGIPGIDAVRVGENMPRVVAWGRTERREATEWGANLGPADAPDYEHDAGAWIQSPGHAQSLRIFLESRITKARPIISAVKVTPDARLQRGDKIRLEDETVTGLAVEGVIFDLHQEGEAGRFEQELSLWVTSVDTPAPKYSEVQDYYNSATYQALQSIFGSGTYAANQSNPMQ